MIRSSSFDKRFVTSFQKSSRSRSPTSSSECFTRSKIDQSLFSLPMSESTTSFFLLTALALSISFLSLRSSIVLLRPIRYMRPILFSISVLSERLNIDLATASPTKELASISSTGTRGSFFFKLHIIN